MNSDMIEETVDRGPWSYLAVKWYAYIFTAFFVLYGGVTIILGILDSDYTGFDRSVVFLLIGIALAAVCVGYREKKLWGWYGMVILNGLVILFALIGYSHPLNFVYLVLSGLAISLLFLPKTKAVIF